MNGRSLVLVVVLAGCGKSAEPGSGSGPPGQGSADVEAPPAPGLAQAAVASLPRDRWPCAITYRAINGRRLSRLMSYELDRCVVPITMVIDTLGGCPAQLSDRKVTYDAEGRLTQDQYGRTYVWTGGGPASIVYTHSRFDFVRQGDAILARNEERTDMLVRLGVDGRPVRHVQIVSPSGAEISAIDLEYDGDRITRTWYEARGVRSDEPQTVHYDCTALPPDDPDPDAVDAGATPDAP